MHNSEVLDLQIATKFGNQEYIEKNNYMTKNIIFIYYTNTIQRQKINLYYCIYKQNYFG